jgi:hypothetical protein
VARAGIVGVLAFVLGVVGYVSADGLLPGPVLLAALLVGSVLLSAPMLNRSEPTPWPSTLGSVPSAPKTGVRPLPAAGWSPA